MADVYRIQVAINLGGNISPELSKILKIMDQTDKGGKGVEKAVSRWASPIDHAAAAMGRFSREVANARKGLGTVDREVARMRSGLAGLKAPASGLDREMRAWAQALGRPLAEMRTMRSTTQGVASSARGVSRSISSWASQINRAASAMQRLQRTAANVHLPSMPHGVGGGTVGGGRGRHGGGNTTLQRRSHGGHHYGQHEGSHLAGAMGVYGGLDTIEYLVDQGAGAAREDLRAKNAGLTAEENAKLRAKAAEYSRQFPSLGQLGIREQARLLIPNVGDFDTAMKVLPEYLKGQVAMQTMSGPEEGGKDMEAFARYIDIIGRSMSVSDTNKLIDSYVRARQLDPEAIRSLDYVNAAKSAASPGKALSIGFWGEIAPALFSQQGGARTGTDLASAYQNTVVGRGTDASILAQYDEGLRHDMKWHWNKNKTKRIVDDKGGLNSEQLYNSSPYEYSKKELVPRMVAKGMLPVGYAHGDFSQDLTDEQRSTSGKYLSKLFSNRRGANIFSMMIQDMDQIEQFIKRLRNTRGTADVLSDQKKDGYVAGSAIKTQGGNAGAALAGPGMDALTEQANRAAAALGNVADWLTKHPATAGAGFGGLLAGVGGTAAAGITALTLAGIGTLTLPALTVGAGATVTIAEAMIPWSAIADGFKGMLKETFPQWYKDNEKQIDATKKAASWYGSMPGYEKLVFAGKVIGGLGKIFTNNLAGNIPEIGPYSFGGGIPGVTPDGAKVLPAGKRAPGYSGLMPGLPQMGSVAGAPEAIERAVGALGNAGSTATTSADGFNKADAGAKAVAGSTSIAGGALESLAGRISALGSIQLPSGVKAVGGGGGNAPAPSAPGKSSSVIYRGGAAPIHVATAVHLDNRIVGRAVTKHIVAEGNVRNGLGRFDDRGLITPVGLSEPITA